MENLPYENLDRLAEHILNANSPAKEKLAATSVLDQMSTNLVQFVKSLMDLASSERTDISKEAKIGASIAALNYIGKGLRNDNQFISIVIYILKAMLLPNTLFEVIKNLMLVLKKLLAKANNPQEIEPIYRLLEGKTKTMTVDDCTGVFCVLKIFTETVKRLDASFLKWFQKIQDNIAKTSKDLVEKIGKIMIENKDTDWNQNDGNVVPMLAAVEISVDIFTELIGHSLEASNKTSKKNRNNKAETLESLIGPGTLELFASVLDLQLPTDKQLPECLISTTSHRKIDRNLNRVKAQALKCFNNILEAMVTTGKDRSKEASKNSFYTYAITTGVDKVLKTLFAVCETPSFDLNDALICEEFEICLTECLFMVSHLLKARDTYDYLFQFYKRLLLNVCLVLLKAGPEEMSIFKNYPEAFLELTEDACNHQELKKPKSQAGHLLEEICENIQGSATFLVTILLNTMQYVLADHNPEVIPLKYPLLQENIDSCFVQEKNPNAQMETSLLGLASMMYLVVEREDLQKLIADFLEQNKDYFTSQTFDALIQSRICTFISYYFDISPKPLRQFNIEFLLNSLSSDPTVALLATEGLSNIFKAANARKSLGPHIEMIALKIAEEIKKTPNIQIYEIFESLFIDFRKSLIRSPELIKVLFQGLIDRLLLIYNNGKHSKDKNRMISNKIWNVIKMISEDNVYMKHYQVDLEQIMSPLFDIIATNGSAPFEEEIVTYVATVTKLTNNMSPACWRLVKVFPKILLKTKNPLGPLFPALNQVIISGDKFIYEDPNFIQTLVELGIQGLTINPKDTDPVISKCEFALLLQLILQHLNISDGDLEKILVATYDVLKQTRDAKLQTKFGGVILSGFTSNFNVTLRVVENSHMEADLLQLYLNKPQSFKYGYDRKLLLTGLCSILTQGLHNEIIAKALPRILNVVVCYLMAILTAEQPEPKKVRNEEEGEEEDDEEENDNRGLTIEKVLTRLLNGQKAPIKGKKNDDEEIDDDNDDDDEDEEDDDGDDDDSLQFDIREFESLMEVIESKIKSVDEFIVFKEAIKRLHRENKQLLKEINGQLPESSRYSVKEVFRVERVVINDRNGNVVTKARKIFKPKGPKEIIE